MAPAQGGTLKSPRNAEGTVRSDARPGVDDACTVVREVLTRIGDKWSVLIIVLLGEHTRRFSEIKRQIEGISQRMLTLTLRGLERDGIVERTVFPTVPPRVEYALTPLGRTLLRTLAELAAWANDNRRQIERARAAFDRREVAEQTRTRSA